LIASNRVKSRQIASTRRIANKQRGTLIESTLRAPSLGSLKSKRKIRRATRAHPAWCQNSVAPTCKNQCADNTLRPQGARVEDPLYLAVKHRPQQPASKLKIDERNIPNKRQMFW
jgi:hypothetical protein